MVVKKRKKLILRLNSGLDIRLSSVEAMVSSSALSSLPKGKAEPLKKPHQ